MTWAAVAVGAGTAIGGAAGGKKSGGGSGAADAQARLAQQLFGETDPIRRALIGRSAGFLGIGGMPGVVGGSTSSMPQIAGGRGGVQISPAGAGERILGGPLPGSPISATPMASPGAPVGTGFDITASPQYAALMDATNRRFAQAKDNTLATVAPGGALTDALTNLESQRAATMAQGAGQAYGDEMSRAMTLATGQTGTAMSGLGMAAQAQALNANAQAEQSAQKSNSLGQAAGAYMGHKKPST